MKDETLIKAELGYLLNGGEFAFETMLPEERQFLVMALNADTEKMENWLDIHSARDFPLRPWRWVNSWDGGIKKSVFEFAFDLAGRCGLDKTMHFLHDHKLSDITNTSLLEIAFQKDDPRMTRSILKTLFEIGMDPNFKTSGGLDLEELARQRDLPDTARLIAEAKEALSDKQKNEATAREKRQQSRHAHTLKRLDQLLKKRA